MVGIILATHGGFADGIMQSGSMIFGDQPDVAAVTLQPSEGPNDIRKKMEDAIASFESQDEVLFLVDLWGGTPFNQANGLVSEHEDKWAIVARLKLADADRCLWLTHDDGDSSRSCGSDRRKRKRRGAHLSGVSGTEGGTGSRTAGRSTASGSNPGRNRIRRRTYQICACPH